MRSARRTFESNPACRFTFGNTKCNDCHSDDAELNHWFMAVSFTFSFFQRKAADGGSHSESPPVNELEGKKTAPPK
jgi:hypothetical protein